jgi:hypothetical protein
VRPPLRHLGRIEAGRVAGAAYSAFQQLDVGLVLAGHVGVFKKDDFLAASVQNQLGNLCVTA